MEHYVIQNIGTSYSNNDDIIFGSLNVGTQIDGLAHLGIDSVFYNGNRAKDLYRWRLKKAWDRKFQSLPRRDARYCQLQRRGGAKAVR